jgi:tRNA (guanine37-N1)-methyltransferase
VIVDAVTRLLPGALGNDASSQQESFSVGALPDNGSVGPDSTCGSGGLLDYPHYTRPADYRGMGVPEELLTGNHQQIRRWRRLKALEKTLRNRPELLESARLSVEDQKLLQELRGRLPAQEISLKRS